MIYLKYVVLYSTMIRLNEGHLTVICKFKSWGGGGGTRQYQAKMHYACLVGNCMSAWAHLARRIEPTINIYYTQYTQCILYIRDTRFFQIETVTYGNLGLIKEQYHKILHTFSPQLTHLGLILGL